MKNSEAINIYKYLLPEGICDHFELVSINEQGEVLTLVLDEKNIYPKEYEGKKLESKGFYPSTTLEDFPIRKYKVMLEVRRRKWRDPITGKTVSSKIPITAQGTSYPKDFASFLKRSNWIITL